MTLSIIQGGLAGAQVAPRTIRSKAPLATPSKKATEFSPSRLLWAREHSMMTRAELAHAANVSVSALAGYEQGRTVPAAATQERLAEALGIQTHFFSLKELDEIRPEAVSFRKASKTPKKHQRAARGDARMAVEIFHLLEKRFKLPPSQVPSLSEFTPTDAAELVREEWHLGDRPITDMMSLLESKGIRILSLDHRYTDVDAFCFTQDTIPYIFVSTAKSGERQRFDLAHELGHLVMHSDDNENTGSKEREKEAQDFASAFLMPASRLYAQNMRNAHIQRIIEAKDYWRVSAMAMAYRLHDLGLLGDWQYRTTAVELTKRGYRTGEPDGIVPERSQLLHKVFHALDKHMTVHDTANALGIQRDILRAYLRDLTIGIV